MLIAHASDLHSNLVPLWNIAPKVDAFVITGDIFPDLHTSFDKAKCANFQEDWFKKKENLSLELLKENQLSLLMAIMILFLWEKC